jgi:hypothetical protein
LFFAEYNLFSFFLFKLQFVDAPTVQVNIVVAMKVTLPAVVLMSEYDISDIHLMNLFSSVMLLMLKGCTSCPSRATI